MQAIEDRGIDYVAQEAVTLSTTPVWRDGRLQPRPFTLRLFLAKVGDGWQVMPGGFVRIAETADARAVSLQRGAATADAWVLSIGPVPEATLLPTPERMAVQRATGALPSRAADNLFWVGRYVERAEATLRLIRALVARMAEADDAAAPVISSISGLLGAWSAAPADSWQTPADIRRAGGADAQRVRRLAAAAGALGARGRLRHSRPLLARRLAHAQRSGRDHRCAAGHRSRRKRDDRAGRGGAAHHLRHSPGWRRRT